MVLPSTEKINLSPKHIFDIFFNNVGQALLDNKIVRINEIEGIVRRKISDNPNLIISIKTTRRTKYSAYISVVDQLKRANALRISIAEPDGL